MAPRSCPRQLLAQMKEPTVETPGSALGDAIGISWMLRDVGGVRMVGHGGDTLGQHSTFDMVPERQFAISGLTNCGPNGNQFLDELGRWALEAYLGVVERDPEPVALDDEALADYAGTYETVAAIARVTLDGHGGLALKAEIKPETLAKLVEDGEEPPDDAPPFPLGILPGPGDRYIVTDGPAKGMKGYFVRRADGSVESVHVGGRLATKVAGSSDAASLICSRDWRRSSPSTTSRGRRSACSTTARSPPSPPGSSTCGPVSRRRPTRCSRSGRRARCGRRRC